MRILIITVICLALAAPAIAGLYQWKDENGKIHFTDDPSQIPPDLRNKNDMKKLQAVEVGKNNPSSAPAAPARKHLGAKKEGSTSGGTGVDKQRVNDLLRLNQKKHYGHK